jgi:rubrerythrin
MKKENGRLKPADPQEMAEIKAKGKVFECGICGYTEVRYKTEFAEQPHCPACQRGLLTEKLPW